MRLYRSWNLYFFEDAEDYFLRTKGISLEDFTKIGFAIYAKTDRYPSVPESLDLSSINIRDVDYRRFLELNSWSSLDAAVEARRLRRNTAPLAYRPSLLRTRPLIEGSSRAPKEYFAPLRDLLMLRITEGIFYDLVSNDDLKRQASLNFERHCWEITKHYFRDFEVSQDIEYNGKVSPDLLISDQDESLLLIAECKARRLPMTVRASPSPIESHAAVYQEIAKGVRQIWKFVRDVRRGAVDAVPQISQDVVGVVITLDPLVDSVPEGGQQIRDIAEREIGQGVADKDKIGVAFVSIEEWEKCLSLYPLHDVLIGLRRLQETRFSGYLLSSVLEEGGVEQSDSTVEQFPWNEKLAERVNWWGDFGQN